MRKLWMVATFLLISIACQQETKHTNEKPIKLITVDPGHFHAALVQKNSYPQVDSIVHLYAPEGNDVKLHLDRIKSFNNRTLNPTSWNSVLYTGNDFWAKMLLEQKGNVVVLAGNNQKKTEYIFQSVNAGLNVLADKPMAIDQEGFKLLLEAFAQARESDLLLYDIMTERYEITSILQRELTLIPEIFGAFETGSPDNPVITKESVHHFYKHVAGKVLVRPPWFFDVDQEGNGLVDVTTHLVDLIQWQCFPGQSLDTTDVNLNTAYLWPTPLSGEQFEQVTKTEPFPDYLAKDIQNDTLFVNCNGEINYQLRGLHAKVSVSWAYKAPEGGGDTHFSRIRGTKTDLVIRQGKEQDFKPELFIEPANEELVAESTVKKEFEKLKEKYPGIALEKNSNGWRVIIPDSYRIGHEAHFSEVTERFIDFLTTGTIPEWEIPNMITKYYTTTKAAKLAKNQ